MEPSSRQMSADRRGLLDALVGDGRFLIVLTGCCLVLAGGFAVFQSATGHFLPHDIEFLGMTARELCEINGCRVVHFMFHDRVSFGGVLCSGGIALVGVIWCAEPSRSLWQLLALVGTVGFSCAIAVHFVIGYTDPLHLAPAAAGAALYALGLVLSHRRMIAG